jgi:hypothetical protein
MEEKCVSLSFTDTKRSESDCQGRVYKKEANIYKEAKSRDKRQGEKLKLGHYFST